MASFSSVVGESEEHPVEKGRYILYVATGCPVSAQPWLVATQLALDTNKTIEIVRAFPGATMANGHFFVPETAEEKHAVEAYTLSGPEARAPMDQDPANGVTHVWDLYRIADPAFSGDASLPLLFDRKANTIVNNCPLDIAEILATRFTGVMMFARDSCDLLPPKLAPKVREEAGKCDLDFLRKAHAAAATDDQRVFERIEEELGASLAELEKRLKKSRWLCGRKFTVADLVLFPMLLHFEVAWRSWAGLQRRSLRRHFPCVWSFVQEIWVMPGVRRAVELQWIPLAYHGTHGHTPTVEDGMRAALFGIQHRKNTLWAKALREAQNGVWVVPFIVGFFVGSEMGHKSQEHKFKREGRLLPEGTSLPKDGEGEGEEAREEAREGAGEEAPGAGGAGEEGKGAGGAGEEGKRAGGEGAEGKGGGDKAVASGMAALMGRAAPKLK